MKHLLPIAFLFTTAFTAVAQAATYDIFSYAAPKGFVLRPNENFLMYEKNEGKEYCQLFIYPVTASKGSIEKDFETYWNFFARNPSQKVGNTETTTPDSLNGWGVLFGAARGSYNNKMFVVTVTAFTKNNFSYYTASVFTDKKYMDIAQQFSSEILTDEKKLAQKANSSNTVTSSTVTINPSPASSLITTQFDDGWTSTYVGPYVTVTKGALQAWIFPVNDSLDKVNRKPEEYLEDKYWRYAVNQFFQIRNAAERPWQMSGSGNDKIFEAEAKNKQTGEEGFVAMRVIWNSRRAQPVIAFAATKEQMYNSVFAQYNSFEQVLPYNKFMPTPQLLQGAWQSSEAGATGSYSVAGGFQGGNAKVGFKDEFIFNAGGSYQSMHAIKQRNETTGDGYVQKYKGSYTLSGTTVQLSNWRPDDPGAFECWLEAAHGGLALILVNKKFTGQRYTFLRSK
jgi:hypothetical protein